MPKDLGLGDLNDIVYELEDWAATILQGAGAEHVDLRPHVLSSPAKWYLDYLGHNGGGDMQEALIDFEVVCMRRNLLHICMVGSTAIALLEKISSQHGVSCVHLFRLIIFIIITILVRKRSKLDLMLARTPPFAPPTDHLERTFPAKSRSTTVSVWAMTGIAPPLPHPIKIVGMGSAGVDYLAQVASFPQPDDKLRTERLEVQGGGNCGNALTAAARLGLSPHIVTKIGDDALGDGIISEFHRDRVNTDCILRAAGAPSPFTYIIVDRLGATRTCIHTPGEAFDPSELTQEVIEKSLKDAALVYFDGRLTEAALLLARAAKSRGVPVLVEAERLRPGLEDLLQEADFVVTSAHFPGNWTGEGYLGDALAVTFFRLPRVQWMITTLGKKGSVLLERKSNLNASLSPEQQVDAGGCSNEEVAEALVERLFDEASAAMPAAKSSLACTSGSGVEIYPGASATASAPRKLLLRRSETETADVAINAAAAAAAEAAANADARNAAGYAGDIGKSTAATPFQPPVALVTVAQAAHLHVDAVLDTTGAGDAFIGSVMYCIATGKTPKEALGLGAVVAACKCTALGARPGLPRRGDLNANLL